LKRALQAALSPDYKSALNFLCRLTLQFMRKPLIGASLLLLTLSAVFGFLNTSKVKALRTEQANAMVVRDTAENARAAQRNEMRDREARVAAASAKFPETEARIASARAELVKSQREKANLQSKLQANESELAALQKRIEELTPRSTGAEGSSGPSAAELQAQLEETRQQLDSAEREKSLRSEKIHGGQERSPQVIEERRQRRNVISEPGLRGTVMAVNQAYNFVVLNLGARQGVEINSEMLVVRGGTLIGKIRVSSVEPATAIGDMISSSLPRGVQVQPGDNVIYAGTGL
jgi:hypothetical protein